MISAIRTDFSLGKSFNRLIEAEVDSWIDGLSARIDTTKLLMATQGDLKIVNQVSNFQFLRTWRRLD